MQQQQAAFNAGAQPGMVVMPAAQQVNNIYCCVLLQ